MSSDRIEKFPVVFVEDSRGDILLVREALAKYQVFPDWTMLPDGDQAVQMIRRWEADWDWPCPKLLILDVNLPKVSGLEVLARLRSSTRCSAIPVVLLSSSAALPDRDRLLAQGASAFIRKPSNYDEFMEIGHVIRDLLLSGSATG